MQSQVVIGLVTSYFVSSGITPFNMIVELRSSNITKQSVNYEVTKFIQRYFHRRKEVEGIVETRRRQHNEVKTKIKEI